VVVNGVMYVTTANECHALDAGTALMAVDASSGTPLWHFQTNTL